MANKIKIEPSYYAIIPADVRYAPIIPNAKLMYGEITALCNKDGYCWATNSYFKELYNVAPTTVSEWISVLAKNGFIRVEIADKTHRKIYLTLREKPKGDTGKAEGYPSGKAEDNNTSINTKTNESFLKFWNIYPKKVEKKKTELKWNRLNKATQDLIFEDLPKRIKSEHWQKGFILNPMTYLNGERWNDQIIGSALNASATGQNWTQQRLEQERSEGERAQIDSPGRKKFDQLKEKFQIGK